MKKLAALFLLVSCTLAWDCASAPYSQDKEIPPKPECTDAVLFIVDSQHFSDVVIRDSRGVRMRRVTGLREEMFWYCGLLNQPFAFFLETKTAREEVVLIQGTGAPSFMGGEIVEMTITPMLGASYALMWKLDPEPGARPDLKPEYFKNLRGYLSRLGRMADR